jgi:predicted Fe-Mo cluster-binding NifX family protein
MKLLIASDGRAMTSRVARHFERATWYLLVEGGQGILDAVRNDGPVDRTRILERAAHEDVGVVVADRIGKRTVRHLVRNHLQTAFERGLTVREVREKSVRGELHLVTVEELQQQLEQPVRPVSNAPVPRPRRAQRTTTIAVEVTPRGQHHLQQYAGRGH